MSDPIQSRRSGSRSRSQSRSPARSRSPSCSSESGTESGSQTTASASPSPSRSGAREGAAGAASDGEPRSIERLACLTVAGHDGSLERIGDLAPDDPVAAAESVVATDRITECFVLTTCNRVEVYVGGRSPSDLPNALEAARRTLSLPADAAVGRIHTGLDAVGHLSRLAAGLESPILGEDEIIGQLRRALEAADEAGLVDGVVGRAAECGLRAGRACRAETGIADGRLDYGTAARDLLAGSVDAPERIAVVGAGEVIRAAVDAIRERWPGVRIDAANRTVERARDLATGDGVAVGLECIDEIVAPADAVVAATGADEPVVGTDALADGEATPTAVVDLGNPADVDPALAERPAIEYWSLADVQRLASDRTSRRRAVPEAEALIDEHLIRFVRRERENRAEETLRALHEHAAAVREAELERARNRLRDGEADPERILEEFATSFAGRLFGPPTDRLREAAREDDPELLRAARELFELSIADESDADD
ncbi:glutamyl-tRNA reductase [Halobiforma lacisalsi AJ5]|uniref:Glutamyl-tRNA reductase n=1 Tax=Natronobacterium lacisalsi AJ5 TaxID=358396 RepID=M0LFZ1_NATLA|nr:glutamyl-tRNA reductase [Halobiforma lacisalsi]APW98631.1 glutamyl-tRNA reductase [Halobiforma lacisalsi AJ5]EMA32497.1 glutamyl-tRNA reductase [Halobiforma lacisalsi AJ5]